MSDTQAKAIDRSVWRNALGLVGGNTLAELLGVLVQAQLIRILGPAGLGPLSQAQAASEVADGIGAFGLNQVGPVIGVQHRDRLGAFMGSVLCVRVTVTVSIFLLVCALAPLFKSTDPGLVRLAAVTLLLAPFEATATIPYFIHQENWRIAWLPGLTTLLHAGLLLLTLAFGGKLAWVLLSALVTRVVHVSALWLLVSRRYQLRLSVDRELVRKLLTIAPQAAWLDAVVIAYSRASYFVLDGLGPGVIGLYALADRITAPILRLSGAFSASALPKFAELGHAADVRGVTGFYLRNVRRVALTLIGLGALLALGLPVVVRTWFADYAGSLPIVFVLYLGVFCMAVNQLTSSCLNGLGHFGWVAIIATINLGVYFIGVSLWVGPHAAVGAAVATTVMEGVNMAMQLGLLTFTLRRLHAGAAT